VKTATRSKAQPHKNRHHAILANRGAHRIEAAAKQLSKSSKKNPPAQKEI